MIVRSALLAAAIALGLRGSAPDPPHPPDSAPGGAVCGGVRWPSGRSATDPHFLGVSTADTVETGPPADSSRPQWTWVEPGRPVRGQVVEVVRVGGAGSEALERVFAERGSRRVVVVPWSTGNNCAPASWGDSAAFMDVGALAMFVADLRPRAEWADGMPTFDIWNTLVHPYPRTARLRRHIAAHPVKWMSAKDYFEFYSLLPPRVGRDPLGVPPELARWQASHKAFASGYPASGHLYGLTQPVWDPVSPP